MKRLIRHKDPLVLLCLWAIAPYCAYGEEAPRVIAGQLSQPDAKSSGDCTCGECQRTNCKCCGKDGGKDCRCCCICCCCSNAQSCAERSARTGCAPGVYVALGKAESEYSLLRKEIGEVKGLCSIAVQNINICEMSWVEIESTIAELCAGNKRLQGQLEEFCISVRSAVAKAKELNCQLCELTCELEQLNCQLQQLNCVLCELPCAIRRAIIRSFIIGLLIGVGIGVGVGAGIGGAGAAAGAAGHSTSIWGAAASVPIW